MLAYPESGQGSLYHVALSPWNRPPGASVPSVVKDASFSTLGTWLSPLPCRPRAWAGKSDGHGSEMPQASPSEEDLSP